MAILHEALTNPFCNCQGRPHQIFPFVSNHDNVERYKYETAALCPNMKKLFPTALLEERIELLHIFAPHPMSGSRRGVNMMNPPTVTEFIDNLKEHGLTIDIGFELLKKDGKGSLDIGPLSGKEAPRLKLALKSCSSQTRDVSILMNRDLEVSGENLGDLFNYMAEMLQNDIIQMVRHGQPAYLIFNFKKKQFGSYLELPPQKLGLELFQAARDALKNRPSQYPYNRDLVFEEVEETVSQ